MVFTIKFDKYKNEWKIMVGVVTIKKLSKDYYPTAKQAFKAFIENSSFKLVKEEK